MGNIDIRIADSWREVLNEEFSKSYFADLIGFVREEYQTKRVFPRGKNIFRAFDKCSFDQVKVVIIGQDPYHGAGQANGLSFSVADGVPHPPSLRNILKEVSSDTGAPLSGSGDLERWAEQGVLLLNAVLTVREGEAASHAGMGWERFTDAVVRVVGEQKQGVVYLLWGAYAEKKGEFIDQKSNCVLRSVHPSPLSAYKGFFGSAHFSQANAYLVGQQKEPIVW